VSGGTGRGLLAPAALAALALAACGGEGKVPERAAAEGRSAAPVAATTPERSGAPRPERPGAPRPERPSQVARPVRIEIPAIGVSAPVIPLGVNRDRSLEVPEDYGDTGWWTGGPEPGERGAAVIAGHVDSKSGPAVFYRLRELRPGDEIIVRRHDGTSVRFVASRSDQHPKDRFPTARVYGRTEEPTLGLITCSGEFDTATGHYTDNAIVFADTA
jgi:LPXTG-site transpeptidase (sortase) family protein